MGDSLDINYAVEDLDDSRVALVADDESGSESGGAAEDVAPAPAKPAAAAAPTAAPKLSKKALKRKRREEAEARAAARPAEEDLTEEQRRKRQKKKDKFQKLKDKRRERAAAASAEAFAGVAPGAGPSAPVKRRGMCGDLQLMNERDVAEAFLKLRREAGNADKGLRVSALEQEDQAREAEKAFVCAGKDARYHSLARLSGLVRGVFPNHADDLSGRAAKKGPFGAPLVLVVSAGAVRSVDVVRALRGGLEVQTLVAKLFSKHMKVKEQQEMLRQTDVRVAVGTPARLRALAASGALSTKRLRLVVLDMQRNAKSFCLLDGHDTRRDFWTLYEEVFQPLVARGQTRLCLF